MRDGVAVDTKKCGRANIHLDVEIFRICNSFLHYQTSSKVRVQVYDSSSKGKTKNKGQDSANARVSGSLEPKRGTACASMVWI